MKMEKKKKICRIYAPSNCNVLIATVSVTLQGMMHHSEKLT